MVLSARVTLTGARLGWTVRLDFRESSKTRSSHSSANLAEVPAREQRVWVDSPDKSLGRT